jgi:hypothetical protein
VEGSQAHSRAVVIDLTANVPTPFPVESLQNRDERDGVGSKSEAHSLQQEVAYPEVSGAAQDLQEGPSSVRDGESRVSQQLHCACTMYPTD